MTQFSFACSWSKTLPARAQQQLSWRHFSLCSTRWQHLRHRQLNQLLPTAIVWTTLRTPLQFHCTRPDRVCTPSTRRGIPVTSTTMVFISSSRHRLRSVEASRSQWVIESLRRSAPVITAAPFNSSWQQQEITLPPRTMATARGNRCRHVPLQQREDTLRP